MKLTRAFFADSEEISNGPVQQAPDVRLQQQRNRRSGPYCFHGETQVQTESGRRAMKDLRVGENILVMNDDQLLYAPVTTFIHRMPEQEALFVAITTSDSNTIRLTREHLLYTTKCSGPIENQQNWALAFAREIEIGDCLFGVSDGIRREKVISISEEIGYGVYAPYTESGTVVADNVVASCHSVHKDSVVQNAFFALYTKLRSAWKYISSAETDFVQLPWFLQFVVASVHTIL